MAGTQRSSVLPGFRLTLGFTLFYLCLIVLVPLVTLPARTATMGWSAVWQTVSDPRVVASYKLSVGAALIAAAVNAVFGLIVAWVLARYQFPGKRIIDAFIDLPFALPTAVAGITLTTLYAPNGWLGAPLQQYGIKVAFTPLGITIALVFIGLPFVVRTLQPVIEDLDVEIEEAATSLGASRSYVLTRIILPYLYPAWLTGFALAFARAVGEYGSVVFISGNMPMRTEIAPLLIITKLEQDRLRGRHRHCRRHAVDLVHAPAHSQCAAGLEQPKARALMAHVQTGRTRDPKKGLTEPAAVRWLLTATALGFLFLFLAVPLAAVFTEAFRLGWHAYLTAITEPDAMSALRLTLTAAAIAVPANLVFGVAAAWAIGKFQFRGKQFLITLIDLPSRCRLSSRAWCSSCSSAVRGTSGRG